MSGNFLVRTEGLGKTYRLGRTQVQAVRDLSLSLSEPEFVALIGPSGSGKSTLLSLIGLLETPTRGRIWIGGYDVSDWKPRTRSRFRLQTLGFIFQSFHLLEELTVLENTALPALAAGMKKRLAFERAAELLDRVGLKERMRHRPYELSGGQRQRVAVARALVNRPRLVLADEPTGNLDTRAGGQIIELLKQVQEKGEATVLLVTHEYEHAAQAERILHLRDGQVERTEIPAAEKTPRETQVQG
ncbi:MAG: ABC transporter ATP-binding protein [Candidatus Omnitrophica bacterium]|nr:ABC transporter ATP-binding protein [Candidatus Omnitrophota bacterium]